MKIIYHPKPFLIYKFSKKKYIFQFCLVMIINHDPDILLS